MSIALNSVILRTLVALWVLLRDTARNGVVGGALSHFFGWIHRRVDGSAICTFVRREGILPRSWPQSLSCHLIAAVVNIPCAAVKWIYRLGRQVWKRSLFCRLLATVGGASFFFLGLLMLVMLSAPHALWNNTYGLLGAVGVTALFVVGSASRQRYRLELERLGPYMIFYMGFICIALVGSLSTQLSMRFFAFHLTGFLLVLLVVSAVRRYEQLHMMVALAVVGLSIAALYGCYQGYVGVEVVASQQDMALNADMPGRVYSFFDNPNNFAELLAMLVPLDFALFLNSRWRGKILSVISVALGVAAIGYTYGRASWLGLALAVMVFLTLMNWRFVPLLIILGVVSIPFLPESIYNRILTIGNMEDTSTRYRFEIYDATANLMKDYWHRGVGLGHNVMQQVFQTYPTIFDGSYPIHTHNNYLQMWGETGILGVLSFLALVLYQLKSGLKAFWAATDKRVRNMLAASLAGFCGILLISVAEYTWFYPRNMFTYWFLFGVIGAGVKLAHQRRERHGQ